MVGYDKSSLFHPDNSDSTLGAKVSWNSTPCIGRFCVYFHINFIFQEGAHQILWDIEIFHVFMEEMQILKEKSSSFTLFEICISSLTIEVISSWTVIICICKYQFLVNVPVSCQIWINPLKMKIYSFHFIFLETQFAQISMIV